MFFFKINSYYYYTSSTYLQQYACDTESKYIAYLVKNSITTTPKVILTA